MNGGAISRKQDNGQKGNEDGKGDREAGRQTRNREEGDCEKQDARNWTEKGKGGLERTKMIANGRWHKCGFQVCWWPNGHVGRCNNHATGTSSHTAEVASAIGDATAMQQGIWCGSVLTWQGADLRHRSNGNVPMRQSSDQRRNKDVSMHQSICSVCANVVEPQSSLYMLPWRKLRQQQICNCEHATGMQQGMGLGSPGHATPFAKFDHQKHIAAPCS
eukprot:363244-Chlamydomonas_euryale.AAC.7